MAAPSFNNTTNLISDVDDEAYSCMFTSTYKVFSLSIVITVVVSTCLGNTLILLSVLRFPATFKGSLYIFIANLATADILLGLVLMLYPVEYIFPEVRRSFTFCFLKTGLAMVSVCVSEGSLLFISIDRYMAVSRPLRHIIHTNHKRKFVFAVVLLWAIGIFGVLVPLYVRVKRGSTMKEGVLSVCRGGVMMPEEFHYISSGFIVLATIVNIVLYIIMTREIRRRELEFPRSSIKRRTKTKMVLVVVVAFIVCWTPFVVTQIMTSSFKDKSKKRAYLCWLEYFVLLGFLNSGVNWVIYGFMNRKFRCAFAALVRCNSMAR